MNDLDDLEDLFDDLNIDGPTTSQMYQLYGIFLKDIVNTPILINGKTLKYNNEKSYHPLCKEKPKAFEHIITRESKHSKKRNFDRERANKIHWIRPVIENVNDIRIKYFEEVNQDNETQYFYWVCRQRIHCDCKRNKSRFYFNHFIFSRYK